MKFLISLILSGVLLSSCQSGGSSSLVKTLEVSPQQTASIRVSPESPTINSVLATTDTQNAPFLDEQEYSAPQEKKTYLINGLVSAVPFIGYGFANLSKKIEGGRLFSYVTPVEGSIHAAPTVLRDIVAAHAKNPNVEINLIGISYGANLVSRIAAKLYRKKIPVHYLGTIEGTSLVRIRSNVRTADNFTCTYLDCTRARARLARGNKVTRLNSFKFKSSHIPLGNNGEMHARVLRGIESL